MKKVTTTMGRRTGKLQDGQLTVGLDLGDRSSFYCVLNGAGDVILEAKVATRPEAMKETFGRMPRSLIALETGTHSPWVSRVLPPDDLWPARQDRGGGIPTRGWPGYFALQECRAPS